jgi:coniferyl-aldehyde dehydrogenase
VEPTALGFDAAALWDACLLWRRALACSGVGASGMGHYHGYEGFLTFSKLRPVFRQARFSSIQLAMQPPYGKRAKLALDWMFRLRG